MFESVRGAARRAAPMPPDSDAWDDADAAGGAACQAPPPTGGTRRVRTDAPGAAAPDSWDGDGEDDGAGATPLLVDDPEGFGAALWRALYGRAAPGTAPPFCVILVERRQAGAALTLHSRPPGIADPPPAAWNDPEVRRRIVEPLLQRAIAAAAGAGPPSLILLPSGAVFAATHAAAYAALVRGCPPPDPRAPVVRVHPAIAEVWAAAGAVANSVHPLIAWSGAVGALLIALVLGVGVWVWWTEIVARLANALGEAPVTNAWSAPLRLAVAVAVSALEVWGLLFLASRVARSVAGVTAALDIAFHAWYGWRAAGDDLAAQIIGVAVGVGTALLPELALVIGVVALARLLPLWPWALMQGRMAWLQLVRVARAEADRYARMRAELEAQQHGAMHAYTVVDADGQAHVYYTYAASPGTDDAAPDADADAADAAPPRGARARRR
jgi:hypothetical protein